MSVTQSLKTRIGIKNFALNAFNADEHVIAFNYVDKKSEVHLLKRECAPLYLEENTSITLINTEQLGVFLLAVTSSPKQSKGAFFTFRIWDSVPILGFSPREIQVEDIDGTCSQDGKFRGQFNENTSDMATVKVDSIETMVAVMTEAEIFIWDLHKTDSGAFKLQCLNMINPKVRQGLKNFALLQWNGALNVVVGESGSLSVWTVNKTGIPVFKSIALQNKPNGNPSAVEKLQRVSPSTIMFDDDLGKLWVFTLQMNLIMPINLPGNSGCCGIYSFIPSKMKGKGTLAVCNEGHSINLYTLEEKSKNPALKPVWSCDKPFKVLFSIAPVNSLVFVQADTLAVASSSNQTLSFWSGLSSGAS